MEVNSESNSEGAGPVTQERKKKQRKCILALLLRPPEKHTDEWSMSKIEGQSIYSSVSISWLNVTPRDTSSSMQDSECWSPGNSKDSSEVSGAGSKMTPSA